jgi:hypothetical protein
MAEETAGIGEAGALVNRATAPQDMAITKGIIHSENNALRKAQMEAKKLAAIDAMKEKQSKYFNQIGIGKYENQIVQDEANSDAAKTIAELATVSGNPKEEYNVITEYTQRERNRGIKDNSISVLNPTKNKGYITFDDAYNIAKKNPQELQTWANSRPFLEKKHLLNPSSGEFVAPVIPKKNLALVFEKAKDDLNYAFKDIASKGRGMNVITSEIPIEAIKDKAISLLTGDVDVYDNLDFNKDFQKYFDDNVKVVVDMAMKKNPMLNREEVQTEIQNKLEPEIKTNYVTQEIQNLAKPKNQMGRSFDVSPQAALEKAQTKTSTEITTNIQSGITFNKYVLGEPDEKGWRKINTYGEPDNTFIEKTENSSNKIKPVEIRRLDDNTFEIKGEIGEKLNVYKITKNSDGTSVQKGDPYTIKVSERDVISKYGLTPPYLNAYYPKSKKSPKVVAPSGVKKAEGKQKLSVAEQMRLAAKNKKS